MTTTYTAIQRDRNSWGEDNEGNRTHKITWDCGHKHRTFNAALECLHRTGDDACSYGASVEASGPENKITEMFGRINDDGDVVMMHAESGELVTRYADLLLWPVGSHLSSHYEHPRGIAITLDVANAIGLEIER